MIRPWLVVFAAVAACAPTVPTAFYTPPSPLDGRPGDVIRTEPVVGAPSGAIAFRVLYVSTGLRGERIVVSGLVIAPNDVIPPAGDGPARAAVRPVVAWAHPTSGVVPACAPSLRPQVFGTIPGLTEFLARGFVVTATDYPGLGTPGPHPYLIGVSEARAVLDLVRAARTIPRLRVGRRFAVWGHSQGGHAALFTGQLAASYAPELELVGVAAAAPATDLAAHLRDELITQTGKVLVAYSLWSWSRIFDVSLDAMVAPAARPIVEEVAHECNRTVGEVLAGARVASRFGREFLIAAPDSVEPWRGWLRANTPGEEPAGAPVLITQTRADEVVRPAITVAFVNRLCRRGETVRFVLAGTQPHHDAAEAAASTAVAWIADRFDGVPAPNDCRRAETRR